jgi:hypothetical protein
MLMYITSVQSLAAAESGLSVVRMDGRVSGWVRMAGSVGGWAGMVESEILKVETAQQPTKEYRHD